MSMPNPSSEWKVGERHEVITALREQLSEYNNRFGNPVPSYIIKDIESRIDLVQHEGAAFLELNRVGILESLEVVLERFQKAGVDQR